MKFFIAICLLTFVATAAALKSTDCGGGNYAARIDSVSANPWPVKAVEGFTFTVNVNGQVRRNVGASSFDLSLYRKVLGIWVKIPCIAGYGSCTYDNGCQLLEALLNDTPIPETCSGIPQQQITLANTITLPAIPGGLGWLVSGTYSAKGDFTDSQGKVLCLELEGTLDS